MPLNSETWREMTSLAFTSGSAYVSFADGTCPEEYTHGGANQTVTNKDIGAKKSLSYRDIMHSQAVAAANWNGINTLVVVVLVRWVCLGAAIWLPLLVKLFRM